MQGTRGATGRRGAGWVVALGALVLAASPAAAQAPADYALLDPMRSGRYLRVGSSGPAVAALQRALTAVGQPVVATGTFGAVTDGCVRRFQAATGCKVDGVVGGETLGALDRALGVGAPAPGASGPAGAGTPPAPPAPGAAAVLRRLRNAEVTPAISAAAVRILREHRHQPYGFEVPFEADGRRYVGRIERHYHPPGGAARPWGHHKGVSVFAVVGA